MCLCSRVLGPESVWLPREQDAALSGTVIRREAVAAQLQTLVARHRRRIKSSSSMASRIKAGDAEAWVQDTHGRMDVGVELARTTSWSLGKPAQAVRNRPVTSPRDPAWLCDCPQLSQNALRRFRA
jgi:hypothetical protein